MTTDADNAANASTTPTAAVDTPTTSAAGACDVPDLFLVDYEQAKGALAKQQYAQAIDAFAALAQRMTSHYDNNELHASLGLVWYNYGMSLYEFAVQEANARIVGGLVSQEDEDAADDAQEDGADAANEAGSAETAGNNEEAAPAAADEQQDEEQDEEEDEVNDFQAAWEAMETARLIFNQNLPSARTHLAEVHLAIGDLSLEEEKFDQAVEEYRAALALKQQINAAHQRDRRDLAEIHYKLAMALEYQERYAEAFEEMEKAMTILKARVDALATALQSQPSEAAMAGSGKGKARAMEIAMSEEDMKKELAELEALLPDVTQRMEDLKQQIPATAATTEAVETIGFGAATSSSATMMAGSLSAGASSSANAAAVGSSASSGQPRDLSSLVKKKKPVPTASSESVEPTLTLKRPAEEELNNASSSMEEKKVKMAAVQEL